MSEYNPQPYVLQSGTITPGHSVVWTTNGVVEDSGAAPPNIPSAPEGYYFTASGLAGVFTYVEPNVAGGPAILDSNDALSEQLVIPAGSTIALSLAVIAASQIANGIPAGVSGDLLGLTGVAGIGQAVSTIENLTIGPNKSTFASITALRAGGYTWTAGQAVYVTGQSFPYVWTASTASDDGAININPTGNTTGYRWVMDFNGPLSPALWGALGGGNDDTAAYQAALNATSGTNADGICLSGLNSQISSALTLTASSTLSTLFEIEGPGQLTLTGTNGTFLTVGPSTVTEQPNTRILIKDLNLIGPGTNSPAGIVVNGLEYSAVENVVFNGSGNGAGNSIYFNDAPQGRISKVWSFAGSPGNGPELYNTHDGRITECHSYEMGIGFVLSAPTYSAAHNGGNMLRDTTANANTVGGYLVQNQYTPVAVGGIAEAAPYGWNIQSSQSGYFAGQWVGPCSNGANGIALQIGKFAGSGVTNNLNVFEGWNVQNAITVDSLNYSVMSKFLLQSYIPGLPAGQYGYAEFGNSSGVTLADWYVQSQSTYTYGINILPTSSLFLVQGGIIGGGTGTNGSSVNWSGAYNVRSAGNYIIGSVLTQGFTTGDGAQPLLARSDYLDYWDRTLQQHVTSTEGFSPGYPLPYQAWPAPGAAGTIAAGATITVDVSGIIAMPTSFTAMAKAEFLIVAGTSGSPNIADVNYLVSNINYGGKIVNTAGTTLSSTISVGGGSLGSLITIHNSSAGVIDAQVLMLDAKQYVG